MKGEDSKSFLANSFTDLMASLAVIFILLTIVFIRNSAEKSKKEAEEVRKSIAEVVDKNSLPLVEDPNDPLSMSVRMGEEWLKFDLGSALVSKAGVEFLGRFIPSLAEQLCREDIRARLDAVLIEGHTDQSGEDRAMGTNNNIRLSQERAFSVLTHSLSALRDKPTLRDCLLKLASASGRGSSFPIIQEGEYRADLSRRVEIRIRSKSNEQRQSQ